MHLDSTYTIGQLAGAAALPTSTVRYYERQGLLQPAKRRENNYRVYHYDMLQRLRFIRAAQATGFTLADVRMLLTLCDGDTPLCQDVQPLLVKRLDEVTQRLQAMQHLQRLLQAMLALCQAQEQDALCPLIESLTAASL